MEETSKVETRIVVEQRVYRNIELALWVEKEFESEPERVAAWKMAFQIGKMYPEVDSKIRGELIDEDIQEDIYGTHD